MGSNADGISRLLKSDASPPERDGQAGDKGERVARSSATCATEDAASRRPVRSGGQGFDVQQPLRLYGYRWVVLPAFMLVNVTIQILWICFAPVAGQAAEYYGVSELQIGLLAMVFMIVYIPVSIPASWAIDTFGLRKAVGFGAALLALFGLLRGLFTSSFATTLLLTIGIAVAQPFLLNAYTAIAARWFGLKERATAVGLMTVAAFLGIVVGEVVTPPLVDRYGFEGMQLVYGIAAAVSGVVFVVLMRDRPPTPPSPPGHEERALVLDGMRHIVRQRTFYVVAMAFLVLGGIFNGLSLWVEGIVRPKGLSPNQAGTLAGAMLIGAIIGAVILPLLSDRYHRRVPVLLLGMIVAVPALSVITFADDYAVLLVSFFALGAFMIGIAPVMYQYGAEITYPAPEGTSNGLFVLAMQISVVFIYAMGWLNGVLGSFTPSLVFLIGMLAVTCGLFALLDESPALVADNEPATQSA
jgi:MFS family permease